MKAFNKIFYRLFLARRLSFCGRNFRIGYGSEIINAEYVCVGDNFFTGPRAYISVNRYSQCKIGDQVMFGPEVMVLGGNHDYKYIKDHMRFNSLDDENGRPIVIGDGAWIGARSIILSGAHVGEGAVIGAGSLVNGIVPPYTIGLGAPCRKFIKRFKDPDDLDLLLKNVNSSYSLDSIKEIYKEFGIGY